MGNNIEEESLSRDVFVSLTSIVCPFQLITPEKQDTIR